MPTLEITRAWSDTQYRSELSLEELYELPSNPAGEILDDFEITDPAVPAVYNSWAPCWLSLAATESCCAY